MAASGKRSTRKVEASTQSDNTMLTIDDMRAIPLFATLAATELQRLAATSADLHLGAGEFVVPEGGDRALYAVLAGKMQVVKLVDGIERTLGWRVPGQIFGEVPIAFGTTFAGGYRASEPSRVLRVDPKEYYAVAAAAMHVSLSTASSRAVARARRKSPPTKRSPSRERVQPNPSR
jgi:CRP-like cAMP-binding protein